MGAAPGAARHRRVGHPSVDPIAAWELLGRGDRDVFRAALPTRCAHRRVMATAVLEDFAAHP